MAMAIRYWTLALLFTVGAALPVKSRAVSAEPPPLAIVVGSHFPVTNLSFAALRSCFMGRRVEVEGVALVPFNLPLGDALRSTFDRAVLGLSPDQVGRFWVDMRIRDRGKPPRTAPTHALAIKVVTALPGAISYVAAGELPREVRVLSLDGKRPGEPAYPLSGRTER